MTLTADAQEDARRPRIVIVGGGFGGLSAAQTLARVRADITLIDRRNHHLFQPLLYQVATAVLSPAQIAQPIRTVFRDQKNVRVVLDEVIGIDAPARIVRTQQQGDIPFDYLILAVGASHDYFGKDDWAEYAPGLKSLEDATNIRRRILEAFERAETAESEDERRAFLTFCIVGGGPTGVEMAGAIAELAHRTLRGEFRRFDPATAQVILIEAGPRVLSSMPEDLSEKARRGLEKLGVTVRTGKMVTNCLPDRIELGEESLACRTIIWAAGVRASAAGNWLAAKQDRAGRVIVEKNLSVPGNPDVFVIGDTAAVFTDDGRPVPGVAPAAKQQGKFVAALIADRIAGRDTSSRRFVYDDQGNLATIGRSQAVVHMGRLKLSGTVAWWFWGIVHIFFLIDFRNRMSVLLDWLMTYLTYGRGSRLITDPPRPRGPDIS